MGWISGPVVFLLIWWTALFCVLPWGNRAPESPETGMAGSAPIKPRILLKFGITTLLTIVLWVIVFILIEIEIINFREIAYEMVREDELK